MYFFCFLWDIITEIATPYLLSIDLKVMPCNDVSVDKSSVSDVIFLRARRTERILGQIDQERDLPQISWNIIGGKKRACRSDKESQ